LEIIKYRRAKNLIVLREAIPSKILVTIFQTVVLHATLQLAIIHSRIVATCEIKCKN